MLARYQHDLTDEGGNLITSTVTVEVRNQITGALGVPYSDDGVTSLGNSFTMPDGRIAFHIDGGLYRIKFTAAGMDQRELTYVGIGTASAYDVEDLVGGFAPNAVGNFAGRTSFNAEGAGFIYLSENGDGASITDPVYFVKRSTGSSDWAGPLYVRGPKGPAGTGMMVAVTDETSPIIAGTSKLTFRAPGGFTLNNLRASVRTASTTGDLVIDVNVGAVTRLSTKLTIKQGEKTSLAVGTTQPVISNATFADDVEITIDVDSGGSGASGLKVNFLATMA
jgi:hypothetical protein